MLSPPERAAHRATIGLAALLAIAAHASTVPDNSSDVHLEQTIGTVTAVEPDARTISVISGVGHALRLTAFRVGATCSIEVDGVAAPLTRLRPGQIVEVRHRGGPAPYVAVSIATRPAPGDGRPK